MVAKTYQGLKTIGEPFEKNKRLYIKVLTKTGSEKEVRWYSEAEYAKLYPQKKQVANYSNFDYKKAFNFNSDGCIEIVKNVSNFNDENMINLNQKYECFQYSEYFGWFVKNTAKFPKGIVPTFFLHWELLTDEKGYLLPCAQIRAICDSYSYPVSTSRYQYSIGERHTILLELTDVKVSTNHFGTKYEYTFTHDATGNVFRWNTAAKVLEKGMDYEVTGTVKEYIKEKKCRNYSFDSLLY